MLFIKKKNVRFNSKKYGSSQIQPINRQMQWFARRPWERLDWQCLCLPSQTSQVKYQFCQHSRKFHLKPAKTGTRPRMAWVSGWTTVWSGDDEPGSDTPPSSEMPALHIYNLFWTTVFTFPSPAHPFVKISVFLIFRYSNVTYSKVYVLEQQARTLFLWAYDYLALLISPRWQKYTEPKLLQAAIYTLATRAEPDRQILAKWQPA